MPRITNVTGALQLYNSACESPNIDRSAACFADDAVIGDPLRDKVRGLDEIREYGCRQNRGQEIAGDRGKPSSARED